MKTLLVLRHAKSSWKHPVEDHDRPLKKRGKRDAARLGAVLRKRGMLPDLIYSSTARRARDTAERVADAAEYSGEFFDTPNLYFTTLDEQLELLGKLDDAYETVMIVGHNPAMEELVYRLTGRRLRMPTAALACLEFEVDSWAEVPGVRGELRTQLIPRKGGETNET